jgi:hypothetical protein
MLMPVFGIFPLPARFIAVFTPQWITLAAEKMRSKKLFFQNKDLRYWAGLC